MALRVLAPFKVVLSDMPSKQPSTDYVQPRVTLLQEHQTGIAPAWPAWKAGAHLFRPLMRSAAGGIRTLMGRRLRSLRSRVLSPVRLPVTPPLRYAGKAALMKGFKPQGHHTLSL